MVGNAACNKCKGAFYMNYSDACYMFQHVFEGTRGAIQDEKRALDVRIRRKYEEV